MSSGSLTPARSRRAKRPSHRTARRGRPLRTTARDFAGTRRSRRLPNFSLGRFRVAQDRCSSAPRRRAGHAPRMSQGGRLLGPSRRSSLDMRSCRSSGARACEEPLGTPASVRERCPAGDGFTGDRPACWTSLRSAVRAVAGQGVGMLSSRSVVARTATDESEALCLSIREQGPRWQLPRSMFAPRAGLPAVRSPDIGGTKDVY